MKILTTIIFTFLTMTVHAFEQDQPILLIGGSYENGHIPFNTGLESPAFGTSVGFGSYLDLGQALSQRNQLIVNEAGAGDATFPRVSCFVGAPSCGVDAWPGMEVQFARSLARVFNFATFEHDAKYVVIGVPNDCITSGSFGILQELAVQCTTAELNAVVDRMIAIGTQALAVGITPIFTIYPISSDLDLSLLTTAGPGALWGISNADWDQLRSIHMTRVANELPNALLVDVWKSFVHITDGLHPDELTTRRAARRVLTAIEEFEAL